MVSSRTTPAVLSRTTPAAGLVGGHADIIVVETVASPKDQAATAADAQAASEKAADANATFAQKSAEALVLGDALEAAASQYAAAQLALDSANTEADRAAERGQDETAVNTQLMEAQDALATAEAAKRKTQYAAETAGRVAKKAKSAADACDVEAKRKAEGARQRAVVAAARKAEEEAAKLRHAAVEKVHSAREAHERSLLAASQAEQAHRDAKAKTAAAVAAFGVTHIDFHTINPAALQPLLTARTEEDAALAHHRSAESDEATKRRALDEAEAHLQAPQAAAASPTTKLGPGTEAAADGDQGATSGDWIVQANEAASQAAAAAAGGERTAAGAESPSAGRQVGATEAEISDDKPPAPASAAAGEERTAAGGELQPPGGRATGSAQVGGADPAIDRPEGDTLAPGSAAHAPTAGGPGEQRCPPRPSHGASHSGQLSS
jgi:hypothetical protein